MYSTPSIVLSYSMLCICLIYGLPLIAARPTDGIREMRSLGEAQGVDSETNPGSLDDGSAEIQSACEPRSQVIEKLAEMNMKLDNVLYPFSAMAETIHSKQKRQSGDSAVVHDDVCRKIANMANVNLPRETETPCPWQYNCRYDSTIYPHYILSAECSSTDCTYPCSQEGTLKSCVTYSTTYTVAKLPENGCGEVSFEEITVPFGCTCKS